MSFTKEDRWICRDCGRAKHVALEPLMCISPDCPSNKKEKTLVELIIEWQKYNILPFNDCTLLTYKLNQCAKDAGDEGKIVGLNKNEIELLRDVLPIGKYGWKWQEDIMQSILKKLERRSHEHRD